MIDLTFSFALASLDEREDERTHHDADQDDLHCAECFLLLHVYSFHRVFYYRNSDYWTDRLDWAGWMGHARASEGHPYTIGNHQIKAVSPLLVCSTSCERLDVGPAGL